MVRIAQASIDERGRASGGQAGNQSGRELNISNWHSGFTAVYRAKVPAVGERIAAAMEAAVANRNIGYDQMERLTLAKEAQKAGWNLSKITTPCETDCSALVAVCVNAAGIPVATTMYTGNQERLLLATGQFTKLTGSGYTTSSEKLRRGDILWKSGHTAVVVSAGESAGTGKTETKIAAAKSRDDSLAGKYVISVPGLHIRAGAGKDKVSLGILKEGQAVYNYGYFTVYDGVRWLLVQTGGMSGYVSLNFIERA